MTHTPGPWHRTDDTPIIIHGDDLKGLAYVIGKTMGKNEAELAEANARLIAAAPDLLEALKNSLYWIEEFFNHHTDVGSTQERELMDSRKAIEAAIAKATQSAEQQLS